MNELWLVVAPRIRHRCARNDSHVLLYSVKDAKATLVGEVLTGKNQQGVIFTRDGKYILAQDYEGSEVARYEVTPNGPKDTGWRLRTKSAAYPAAIGVAPLPTN